MKRLRRIAAAFAALLLGLGAWFTVLICYPTEGELHLARQLSTGWLVARVPEMRPVLFGRIVFRDPQLSGRFVQPDKGQAGPLPMGIISAMKTEKNEQLWVVRLDPLDKSWEIEITEKRPVYLWLGGKSWRIGTKTRLWRTHRVKQPESA